MEANADFNQEQTNLSDTDFPIEDMESAWREYAQDYRNLRRGDVVDGTVVSVDRDGMLVDIGSKSEGVVSGHELQHLSSRGEPIPTVGESILVYVVQPESSEGQVILSLERARAEKGWRVLQKRMESKEAFEAEVVDANKGGLIVNVEGVRGFVPASQIVSFRPDPNVPASEDRPMAAMIGKSLRLKVIEMNRRRNRVILSEREAMQEWRSQRKEQLLAELRPGEIRRGTVTSLCSFGAFIDLGGADGLAHLSELSWDRVDHPSQVLKVGDEVDVYITSVDLEDKKIALSLRKAQPEPWADVADRYEVGQLVQATVTKLAPFGAFARVEGGVEGLIHVSELTDRRIQHPKEVIKEGDELTVRIVKIEPERRRLALSLRQAQDDAYVAGGYQDLDGNQNPT